MARTKMNWMTRNTHEHLLEAFQEEAAHESDGLRISHAEQPVHKGNGGGLEFGGGVIAEHGGIGDLHGTREGVHGRLGLLNLLQNEKARGLGDGHAEIKSSRRRLLHRVSEEEIKESRHHSGILQVLVAQGLEQALTSRGHLRDTLSRGNNGVGQDIICSKEDEQLHAFEEANNLALGNIKKVFHWNLLQATVTHESFDTVLAQTRRGPTQIRMIKGD